MVAISYSGDALKSDILPYTFLEQHLETTNFNKSRWSSK